MKIVEGRKLAKLKIFKLYASPRALNLRRT